MFTPKISTTILTVAALVVTIPTLPSYGSRLTTNNNPNVSTAAISQNNPAPAGIDPKLTSTDFEYGYTQKKPVKVGAKDELGGPNAERIYLSTLRDEAGKPIAFRRIGSLSGGSDGHILDNYEGQTSTGRKVSLYIDMYHPKNDPKKQLAPKGLFKASTNPE